MHRPNRTSALVAAVLAASVCGLRAQAPPNDVRGAAEPVSGESWVATGTAAGAGADPGEPAHGGKPAERSVWFRWTAPSDGPVELVATAEGGHAPPRLGVYPAGAGSSVIDSGGAAPSVMIVVDRSTSTRDVFQGEAVGDVNGDGWPDRVLDAEIAAALHVIEEIRRAGFGETAWITLIDFGPDADRSGAWRPDDDYNHNLVPDVEEHLRGIRTRTQGTNYEAAFQDALPWVSASTPPRHLFFFSDGEPTAGGDFSDELGLLRASEVELHAFGTGTDAKLGTLSAIDPGAVLFDDPEAVDELLLGAVASGAGVAVSDAEASRVVFSARAGETYDIAVDLAPPGDAFILACDPVSGVVIGDVPEEITVAEGDTLSIPLSVSGVGDITVRWYQNGHLLLVTEGSSLFRWPNITPQRAGIYVAEATNGFGFARTPAIIVHVVPPPPVITAGLAPVQVAEGSPLRLSVVVESSVQPSFTWKKDGEVVYSGSSAVFEVPEASPADAGRYEVVVANGGGLVASGPVMVTVVDPLNTAWEGIDAILQPHTSPQFSAGGLFFAAGNGPLMVSADGVDWTMCEVERHLAPNSLAYRDGQFLATDVDYDSPLPSYRRPYLLYHSNDGFRWEEIPNPLNLTSVVAAAPGWVATRQLFDPPWELPNPLYFSPDANTWTRLPFVGSQTVLVGSGSDWRHHAPASTSEPPGWFTSGFDDSGWSLGAAPFGYGGEELVTILQPPSGAGGISQLFRTMVTEVPPQTNVIEFNLRGGDGARIYWDDRLRFSSNLPDNADAITPALVELAEDEEAAGRRFARFQLPAEEDIVVGVATHPVSGTDPDLSFDLELVAHDALVPLGLHVWNDLFVVVGRDGRLASSLDGVNWMSVVERLDFADTNGDEHDYVAIASAGRFLALNKRSGSRHAIWTTDGVTWHNDPVTGPFPDGGAVWLDNEFVSPGDPERHSTDGLQWAERPTSGPVNIVRNGDLLVGQPDTTDPFTIWTASGGGPWTEHESDVPEEIRDDLVDPWETWDYPGFAGTLSGLITTDGTLWSPGRLPTVPSLSASWPSAVIASVQYTIRQSTGVAIDVGRSTAFAASPVVEWTRIELGFLDSLFDPASAVALDGRLIVLGDEGVVIVSDDLGETWRATRDDPLRPGTGLFVANSRLFLTGIAGKLAVSLNGDVWVERTVPHFIQEVVYASGYWVAAGLSGDGEPDGQTRLLVSQNGLIWDEVAAGAYGEHVLDLAVWDGGVVALTQDSKRLIFASGDFTAWQELPRLGVSWQITSISSVNGVLLAALVNGGGIYRLGVPSAPPFAFQLDGVVDGSAVLANEPIRFNPTIIAGSREGATIEYFLDGEPIDTSGKVLDPIAVRIPTAGDHLVSARMVDANGTEAFASVSVTVTYAPPAQVFAQPIPEILEATFVPGHGWFGDPGSSTVQVVHSIDARLWRLSAPAAGSSASRDLAAGADGALWRATPNTLEVSRDYGGSWEERPGYASLADSFGSFFDPGIHVAPGGRILVHDLNRNPALPGTLMLGDPDGTNWATVVLPAAGAEVGQAMGVGGGQAVFVGVRAAEAVSWTSADGLNWSGPHALPTTLGSFQEATLTFSGDLWAAVVEDRRDAEYFTSPDGRTWARVEPQGEPSPPGWRGRGILSKCRLAGAPEPEHRSRGVGST